MSGESAPPLTRESLEEMFRLDKSALDDCSLRDQDDDKEYWLSCTPARRIAALEYMRMVVYGTDPANDRLERVLEDGWLKPR